MSGDALATLLRIRRNNLDEAQRAVADALRLQQQAQARRETEETRYAEETVAALDLSHGDEAVDAFARWLPVGRKAIDVACQAEQEAFGEVDRARIVLGLARAAHRAVELLMEKRTAEERRLRDCKLQREMDDLGGRARSA